MKMKKKSKFVNPNLSFSHAAHFKVVFCLMLASVTVCELPPLVYEIN